MTLDKIIPCGSVGLALLLTLFEFSPIKINPWSWIFKKIGNALVGELTKKVDSMRKEFHDKIEDVRVEFGKRMDVLDDNVRTLDNKNDEMEAVTWRYRIIRFGDECRHGVHHSEEHFDQIMTDITEYNRYCDEHPKFKNDKAVKTIEIIGEVYKECSKENSFLK